MMMNCSRAAETDAPVSACVRVCVGVCSSHIQTHTHTRTNRKTAEGESRESSHTDVRKEKGEMEQGRERRKEFWKWR